MDFSAIKHTLEQQRSQLSGATARPVAPRGVAAGALAGGAMARQGAWPDPLARVVSGAGSGADLVIPSKARLAELRRVEAALARMREGSFGFCQICGDEISADWLDQSPACPFCKTCAG